VKDEHRKLLRPRMLSLFRIAHSIVAPGLFNFRSRIPALRFAACRAIYNRASGAASTKTRDGITRQNRREIPRLRVPALRAKQKARDTPLGMTARVKAKAKPTADERRAYSHGADGAQVAKHCRRESAAADCAPTTARCAGACGRMKRMARIVLASASPRRAEILRNAGIPFEVLAAEVDEARQAGELRGDYVRRLALEKARAAAADSNADDGDCLFVGADTVVVAGDEILGKPRSEEDARRMLRKLSGNVHEVHTGLAMVERPRMREGVVDEVTRVTFAPLSEEEIGRYVATGEPFDKAGAYGIQGIGGRYVTRIEGCYFNVMGLPLARLWSLLQEFGWKEPAARESAAKK
jgi:nucleoside triphosphate pyrophosphatase